MRRPLSGVAKARFDEVSARVTGEIGTGERYKVDGFLNIPIGNADDLRADRYLRKPSTLRVPTGHPRGHFADALAAYAGAHASLAEQVAATTAILEAAKTTQVSKATKTLAKGSSKPALPAPSRSSAEARRR